MLAFAAGSCGPLHLRAADIQWSGVAGANWTVAGNWVGGAVPGAGDNAHLDVSDHPTDIDPFDDPGFNSTIQQLYIGESNANAMLTQSSGTLNLNGSQAWLKIGANGGSSGIYNLQGTGVLLLTNDVLGVGESGVGNFNLSNSARPPPRASPWDATPPGAARSFNRAPRRSPSTAAATTATAHRLRIGGRRTIHRPLRATSSPADRSASAGAICRSAWSPERTAG